MIFGKDNILANQPRPQKGMICSAKRSLFSFHQSLKWPIPACAANSSGDAAVPDLEMAPKIRFLAEKNKTWTPARLN